MIPIQNPGTNVGRRQRGYCQLRCSQVLVHCGHKFRQVSQYDSLCIADSCCYPDYPCGQGSPEDADKMIRRHRVSQRTLRRV
jgi:hypothetical protein